MIASSLQVTGTFYVFGFVNFFGVLFCLIWIKETFGLTDKEKKSLFASKNKIVEKLSDEEISQNTKEV